MNNSYQVQVSNDLDDRWTPMTPPINHGSGAGLAGDYWHTSMREARVHADKLSRALQWREVRIVRKDMAGQISVAVPAV
jgi:hypothetical protein